MYKVFDTIGSLYDEILTDKNWIGAESSIRNRYPLRFVLFENFADFNDFVQECSDHGVFVQSIEEWMPNGSKDRMLTHSQLAKRFEDYVKSVPSNDYVIAPFSEITRFYENDIHCTFDSLLKTIRLIESPVSSQEEHQRIYVPIIGMQGKIDRFKNDSNIHIWEYRTTRENTNYTLILTRGTFYGIKNLEDKFTVCNNLREWISLWKVGNNIKSKILCSSKCIFDNASYAQPDNAFDYIICNNAFEFLKKVLNFDTGDLQPSDEDLKYWEELASYIDSENFDFEHFVNEMFNTYSLNDQQDFVNAWFYKKDSFSRWVLRTYYLIKFKNNTYLSRVLNNCVTQSSPELFSQLATQIFEESYNEESIKERLALLNVACEYNVQIKELAEQKLDAKLRAIAADPERGYFYAMKYMTPLTYSEKLLMIQWLGNGYISREEIKRLLPDLYEYTTPFNLQLEQDKSWINSYFTEYCKSKIGNNPTNELNSLLNEKNNSPISFERWRENFKTVKTLLYNRSDIDLFYWIDGLGTDWIPFIIKIIEEHKVDGVYLNEIHIATSILPSRTAENKIKLEELAKDKLEKIGDIDSYAHTNKKYPNYILEEFSKIKKAISDVLSQYNGKKIAFISDHGISYMACKAQGLNLAGIKSDHSGRCAVWENGKAKQDNNYIILEDGKTICSLTHSSLTSKTPDGVGAHGGATPEEVLVPIIIVSSEKNASSYSVTLLDNEITASNPVIRYMIKGLSNIDVPLVHYNGVDYSLHKENNDIYVSEKINIECTSTKVTLTIGSFNKTDTLSINTGVEEDDLFGDF